MLSLAVADFINQCRFFCSHLKPAVSHFVIYLFLLAKTMSPFCFFSYWKAASHPKSAMKSMGLSSSRAG